MITIKNNDAMQKMRVAGNLLAQMFEMLEPKIAPGITTFDIDSLIENYIKKNELNSCSKGYLGYKYSSCISLNDEVVHGVPSSKKEIKDGDLVKVDVCVSYKGYCADMARCFFMKGVSPEVIELVRVSKLALDKGIDKARPGNRLSDISSAIETEINNYGYGIVKEFAGHGIGAKMHEDPEILNYGSPGRGPVIKVGMAFAIEPMITLGKHNIFIEKDGWTVKTVDGKFAAHVEDTVIVMEEGPMIITRL